MKFEYTEENITHVMQLIRDNLTPDLLKQKHRDRNKRNPMYGHCKHASEALIELQTDMCKELYIKTLFHELTHLAQWVDGSLRFTHGKMCYCQEPVENYDYKDQPHEIEARDSEIILYDLYMSDKQGSPVKQVAQGSFPNRLMAV